MYKEIGKHFETEQYYVVLFYFFLSLYHNNTNQTYLTYKFFCVHIYTQKKINKLDKLKVHAKWWLHFFFFRNKCAFLGFVVVNQVWFRPHFPVYCLQKYIMRFCFFIYCWKIKQVISVEVGFNSPLIFFSIYIFS